MQTKQEIFQWLEQNRNDFIDMADRIWEYAEISHQYVKYRLLPHRIERTLRGHSFRQWIIHRA